MPLDARDFANASRETTNTIVDSLAWEDILAGGLAAIGIATGTGPLSSLALKAGGKLASKLAKNAAQHWSSQWLNRWAGPEAASDSTKAISDALERAFGSATDQLRADWKRTAAFLELKARNPAAATQTLEALASFRKEVDSFLSSNQKLATLLKKSQSQIALAQGHIKGESQQAMQHALEQYFHGFDQAFVTFLLTRFPHEWTLHFGHILRSNTPEGTRAWRAYQQLWQESLQAGLDDSGEATAQTREMLTWLREWAEKLKSTPVGQRDPTGEDALEAALRPVKQHLDEIKKLAKATLKNTEQIKISVAEVSGTVQKIRRELRQYSVDARKRPEVRIEPGAQVTQIQVTQISDDLVHKVRPEDNPYLGLRSFTYDDRGIYAGRKSLVDVAVQLLTTPGSQRSILFVTGASGSGKSSFAEAGVLPALEQHYSRRKLRVEHAVFRPSLKPLAMLTDALLQLDLPPQQELQPLNNAPDPLRTSRVFNVFVREKTPTDQVNLLIIDQFEEMFTQAEPGERQALFAVLTGLDPVERSRTHIIVTMRSDYLRELLYIEDLYKIAMQGIDLPAMSAEELKKAIQRPVQDVYPTGERRWEPALVDRLARDAAVDATYLPLLQVTLEKIWDSGSLTLDRYGTLTDAVKERAEAIYKHTSTTVTGQVAATKRLRTQEEQAEMMNVFLDLVDVSLDKDTHRDVRRRRIKSDLIAESVTRAHIINDLLTARLLSTSVETTGAQQVEVVDIIHETLIRNWDRLQKAIADGRPRLQLRVRFEQAVREWASNSRSDDYLLVSGWLTEALALDRLRDISLRDPGARELLNRSRARQDEAKQKELDEVKRRAKEQAQVNRRLRRSAIALVVLLFATLAGAGIAVLKTNEATQAQSYAERQERIARAQALIASSKAQLDIDPELGVLLAMQAVSATGEYDLTEVPQAEDALHLVLARWSGRVLRGHADQVTSVVYSPDGKHILTASRDGTASVWDDATGKRLLTVPPQEQGHSNLVPLRTAYFSPDGKYIVTASDAPVVSVWDAQTGERVHELIGHTNVVLSATYSPDGRYIVTASADYTARIWDAQTGKQMPVVLSAPGRYATKKSDHFWYAAYSPDGKRIVTGSEYGQVWNAQTGRELFTFDKDGPTGVLRALFSPNGNFIASSDAEGLVKLWNAKTGTLLRVLDGHYNQVWGLAISKESDKVVSASWDHTVKVWDAESGRLLSNLTWHKGQVLGASFSPDAQRIATSSQDKTVVISDPRVAQELPTLYTQPSNPSKLNQASYSPDGSRILTAGEDGSAVIWDAATQRQLLQLRPHTGPLPSAEFSTDGELIVTASGDGTAQIWDANTGAALWYLLGHTDVVDSAVFSPDDSRIVTASWDRTARVWDTETGRSLFELVGHTSGVVGAHFSPDGNRIATSSWDKTVRLWDAHTGTQLKVLTGPDKMFGVAFSPDGKLLAASSDDSSITLWDARTLDQLGVLRGHTGEVRYIAFSPDSKFLVSAATDTTAIMWDVGARQLRAILRGHTKPVTSATFSRDGTRILTAGLDGLARQYMPGISDLMTLAASRVSRDLTNDERAQYLGEPAVTPVPNARETAIYSEEP